jgi:hypothetical protein
MSDNKEQVVLTEGEIKLVEDFLLERFKFSKEVIKHVDDFKNKKASINYLVEYGMTIEKEFDEWFESSQHKKSYFRTIFFNHKTKKTFIDMVTYVSVIKDKEDKPTLEKKYFFNKIKEYSEDVLEDDYLLDSDDSKEEDSKETDSKRESIDALKESLDSQNLVEVDPKLYWNIIKYIIYHESVTKYKILVECA